jgi:hypothetical protein
MLACAPSTPSGAIAGGGGGEGEMTPLKQLLARIRLSIARRAHRHALRHSTTEASAFSRVKAARSVPKVVAVGMGMQSSASAEARAAER